MNEEMNLYAMIDPQTEDDLISLLNEALSELKNINQILDDMYYSKDTGNLSNES